MTYNSLPPVEAGKHYPLPHFPSRFHAAVFRLWETVPAERIADALEVPLDTVLETARDMGLPEQKYSDLWAKRGYITTIRNAWQLLPYDQLLRVLGWDEARLALALKDEDFLYVKLGNKPDCEPVRVTALNDEEREQLGRIRKSVEAHFSALFDGAEPFRFFEHDADAEDLPVPDCGESGFRMIYSYCGLYANVLEEDVALSYPDALLRQYEKSGVNAVWLPVVLSQLVPFPFDESYSRGWEKRQERLCTLVERAKAYGIKVYLYLNEPRCMPLSFFDDHAELRGRVNGSYASLCTSRPEVMDYLRYAVRTLCESVKGLGGFFAITCSENLTHCKSQKRGTPCPTCADVPIDQLVSDVLIAIYEESTRVDPNLKTVAWTWAWDTFMTEQELFRCIDRLPREIVIQCNSEAKKPYTIGGVSGTIQDYSISIPGPSPLATKIWSYARERGHEVSAKVQINASWECSTVPFLPVFDLIREHMTGLRTVGVDHLMLSWTLGGYPSESLRVASECLTDPDPARYRALLQSLYGEHAETVGRAATLFSDAFREFPFHITVLYQGPQNAGPSNPLFIEPSGFASTMTCYAYDDLDKWRAIYPREVFLSQLEKLADGWAQGLEVLREVPDCSFVQCAEAAYTIFRSSYLQAEFIVARESGDGERMRAIAREERELALRLYRVMQRNAAFGYEAANHYYYNKGMLAEKVLNCEQILTQLSQ